MLLTDFLGDEFVAVIFCCCELDFSVVFNSFFFSSVSFSQRAAE